jgi:hypothetical protein
MDRGWGSLGLGRTLRFGEELSGDTFDTTSLIECQRRLTGDYESHTCVEACHKSKRMPTQFLRRDIQILPNTPSWDHAQPCSTVFEGCSARSCLFTIS